MAKRTTAAADNVAIRLAGIDDQIAACRAWGHEWPSRRLRPGRALPRGFVPRLGSDGYVEISETCLNECGKIRRWYLAPGGIFDLAVVRRYTDPKNWKVVPRSTGITRRHMQGEVIRRVNEAIVDAAKREAARLEREEKAAAAKATTSKTAAAKATTSEMAAAKATAVPTAVFKNSAEK